MIKHGAMAGDVRRHRDAQGAERGQACLDGFAPWWRKSATAQAGKEVSDRALTQSRAVGPMQSAERPPWSRIEKHHGW